MEDAREVKTIYELFRLSLWVKAIGSLVEMAAGALIVLVPQTYMLRTALLLTQGQDNDGDDFLVRGIANLAHTLVVSNELLIGTYIFVRGLVQLILVYALFRNKLWAYPLLIIVLIVIIATQGYAIYLSHSIATVIITIIDAVTVYLVWREYRIVLAFRSTVNP